MGHDLSLPSVVKIRPAYQFGLLLATLPALQDILEKRIRELGEMPMVTAENEPLRELGSL
jgi:hypothetical protein